MIRQRPQTDELPYNALLKENKKDVTTDLMNVEAKENASISRYMKDYNGIRLCFLVSMICYQ